jgi:hypothetical protein
MIFRVEEKFVEQDLIPNQSWAVQICDETGFPIGSALISPFRVSRIISQQGSELAIFENNTSSPASTKFYRCSNYSIIEKDQETIITFN